MLPTGSRGVPLLTAFLEEDSSVVAPPGQDLVVRFAYAYKASPWSSVSTTAAGTGVTSDGSGEAVGRFMQPGGAVPPGLRTPFDLAGSVQTVPGSSTYHGNATLRGIDVDIAVVEGGYWIRWRQKVAVAGEWTHNAPWYSDIAVVTEVWAKDFTKGWEEGVESLDNWSVELNAPLVYDELVMSADEWELELNP